MAAPNVPQGVVNRAVNSITINDFPGLNVTPPFMGRPQVRFARDGNAVDFLGTATGAARSPNLYMLVTITVALLKTQSLSAAYEAKLRTDANLGPITVRPDVTEGIGPFDVADCAIETVGELPFDGSSPDYGVVIRGTMPINSNLFP